MRSKRAAHRATGAPVLTLRGEGARQQLLVTGKLDTNAERDFTRQGKLRRPFRRAS
jgi:hypothetical protein